MMTFEDIVRLRVAAENQRQIVYAQGLLNTPTDAQEMVQSQALYRIERDKLRKLESEYQAAFNDWYEAGMPGDKSQSDWASLGQKSHSEKSE